jgi:hypothetical protein
MVSISNFARTCLAYEAGPPPKLTLIMFPLAEVIKTRMMLVNAAATAPNAISAGAAAAASRLGPSTSGATSSSRARSSTTGSPDANLSLQRPVASSSGRGMGLFATARQIVNQEGPHALTRGIQASAARAVFNGGIRLGLYGPIKGLLSSDGDRSNLNMGQKVIVLLGKHYWRWLVKPLCLVMILVVEGRSHAEYWCSYSVDRAHPELGKWTSGQPVQIELLLCISL